MVYLDVESHQELGQDPAGRWDRTLHTRLVRRLARAGAKAIVFDVVFDAPWPDPAVDREFANAMREHGTVVLAAERHRSTQATGDAPGVEVQGWVEPTPVLAGAARRVGAAEVAVDEDFVARRALRWIGDPQHPGLAWAALEACGEATGRHPTPSGGEWTRYYGAPLSLPHVSYRNALDPEAVDDGVFRGRTVFVGSRPMVGVFRERRDELRHPLAPWGGREAFLPGVEVHATQWLNWVRGETLRRMPTGWERLLVAVVGALLAIGLVRSRPVAGAILAASVAVGGGVVAAAMWWGWGIWYSWLTITGALAPFAWAVSILHHGVDWQLQRRRLEAQRQADRRKIERQAALLDKAQDLIVVTDLEGRVTYVNPAARTALAPKTAAGKDLPGAASLLVSGIPEFDAKRQAVVEKGEWVGSFEFGPADAARFLECRWTLIRDESGQPEAILMIALDATEKRRLEVEFLRARKWETVGSLAGGMAHDLNNRLAPALLGLQLLQESAVDEKTRRMLATIESHTRRGSETVREVLSFLRGGTVPMSTLDPGRLVRELEALVRDTFPRSVQVASLIPPRVGRVRGNVTQLQQALLNLCLNARDAMPDGGELTLAVDDVDLGEAEAAELRGGRAGAYVLMAVSDSGTGIPPELRARIFDPPFHHQGGGQGHGAWASLGVARGRAAPGLPGADHRGGDRDHLRGLPSASPGGSGLRRESDQPRETASLRGDPAGNSRSRYGLEREFHQAPLPGAQGQGERGRAPVLGHLGPRFAQRGDQLVFGGALGQVGELMFQEDQAQGVLERLALGIATEVLFEVEGAHPGDGGLVVPAAGQDLPGAPGVELLQVALPPQVAGAVGRIFGPGDFPATDVLAAGGQAQGFRGIGPQTIDPVGEPPGVERLARMFQAVSRVLFAMRIGAVGVFEGAERRLESGGGGEGADGIGHGLGGWRRRTGRPGVGKRARPCQAGFAFDPCDGSRSRSADAEGSGVCFAFLPPPCCRRRRVHVLHPHFHRHGREFPGFRRIPLRLPRDPEGGGHRPLPRNARGRSVPLVGGRQCRGDKGLGGTPEPGHLRVSRVDRRADGDLQPADAALELRAMESAEPPRRRLLRFQEQWTAEPVGHLHPGLARR